MAESHSAEFTGERVIPSLVDPNLLNEHVARYRFAARFSAGAVVLDAGCGTGYGTIELANATRIFASDISAEALNYAHENFARPAVHFLQAACEALPFADASFDLVTAFEVIEHLEHWPELLAEARRVLKTGGVLLVSTPNKSYYAEMRVSAGPNPFHCHEFEYEEFRAALHAVFPHVRLWAQNHVETIVFAPQPGENAAPGNAILEASGDPATENAHFFVAACSQSPLAEPDVFAWLPSSANLLREREHHIAKLEGEIVRKDLWLNDLQASHAALNTAHKATLEDLRQRTFWARELDTHIRDRDDRIKHLQEEADERLRWITELESHLARANAEIQRLASRQSDLEDDLAARTAWARSIESQLAERTQHVLLQAREIERHLENQARQTAQIEELQILREDLRRRQESIAQSKWIQLGRRLHLGPTVNDGTVDSE